MPGGSTTGAPDWRDAAKLRKFLADDIPQWTPSEGAENTRAFLAALREKCSTEIGAMTGLLLALFEERVDASKAGFELAQKLKRGGGGATPREELEMEINAPRQDKNGIACKTNALPHAPNAGPYEPVNSVRLSGEEGQRCG